MPEMEYLTSKEVIKLFIEAGLSESTFRRRVKDKVIASNLPEGRKRGALYLKNQVLAVIEQEGNPTQKQEQESRDFTSKEQAAEYGETDWVKESDLGYLLALDIEMYGIENAVDISTTYTWWRKNPTACRIIFNRKNRKEIWGAISVIPIKEETILKLLKGEMQEKQITADDVLSYEEGHKYCAYIPSAIIKRDHRQSLSKLVNSFFDFLCEIHPNIQITKFYAFAFSDEGLNFMKYLFFSPRYDLGNNTYELDIYKTNPSPFVRRFQKCIAAKEQEQQ